MDDRIVRTEPIVCIIILVCLAKATATLTFSRRPYRPHCMCLSFSTYYMSILLCTCFSLFVIKLNFQVPFMPVSTSFACPTRMACIACLTSCTSLIFSMSRFSPASRAFSAVLTHYCALALLHSCTLAYLHPCALELSLLYSCAHRSCVPVLPRLSISIPQSFQEHALSISRDRQPLNALVPVFMGFQRLRS